MSSETEMKATQQPPNEKQSPSSEPFAEKERTTEPVPNTPSGAPANNNNRGTVPTSSPQQYYTYDDMERKGEGMFGLTHPLLFCSACFMFLSLILLVVAVATTNWYIIIHGQNTMKYGMYRTCQNDRCQTIEYKDFTSPHCKRTAGAWKFRNNVAQATALSSIVLCLVNMIFAMISKKILTEKKCTGVMIFCSLGTVLLLLGGVVRFVFTYEIWLFCDENYCKYQRKIGDTQVCDASFGYSFGIVLIAMGSAAVSLIFCIAKLCLKDYTIAKRREMRSAPSHPSPTGQTRAPSPGRVASSPATREHGSAAAAPSSPQPNQSASTEPHPTTLARDSTGKPKGLPAPPPGNWEFHDDCGLYWSPDEYLYLDPHTRHYYDPQSDMWYDPESDQWYEGATH